ncbi:hypothetical protein [Streptomyces sp. NPDC056512]|uniref:hypothetical protein n=1 Tax=Streptomyces sp. NPDC056512 TaxID=3345846 RepID=UPI0036C5D40A
MVLVKVDGRRVTQWALALAWRARDEAVAVQAVEIGVLKRGDPGHVLIQAVMLPLLGRQGPQMVDGGVEVAVGPSTAASRTRPSAPRDEEPDREKPRSREAEKPRSREAEKPSSSLTEATCTVRSTAC